MANVVLPIASVWLVLGGTIDLFSYDIGSRYSAKSIFSDSDVTEKSVDILNSTYYVVQDEKLPYSAMGLPIDLVRRVKSNNYNPSSTTSGIPRILKILVPDRVVFLTVTDYKTVELSLKENAAPVSGWQESVPKTQTHYADKMHYGGRCIGMAEIMSDVPGDIQVVRKILTDVMGSSGPIGGGTLDLWKKAIRTVNESPDVRGSTYFKAFSAECQNVMLPRQAQLGLETFLEALPNVKSFTNPYNREQHTIPIDSSFKPLRNLDGEYPAVEKNKVSEEYLVALDEMVDDLEITNEKFRRPPYISREDRPRFRNFTKTVQSLRTKIRKLMYGEISIYKDLDEEKFKDAFKTYKAGLNEEINYYSALKKLVEDIGTDCGTIFFTPTSGILVTNEHEVLSTTESGEDGLEECQEQCQNNARCRAVGYGATDPHQCRIYHRSTNTAKIFSPGEESSEKVYDRRCPMKE